MDELFVLTITRRRPLCEGRGARAESLGRLAGKLIRATSQIGPESAPCGLLLSH